MEYKYQPVPVEQLADYLQNAVEHADTFLPVTFFRNVVRELYEIKKGSKPVYINKEGYEAIQDILASRMSSTGRYVCLSHGSGHPVEKRYPLYLSAQPAQVVVPDTWPRKLSWSYHDDITQAEVDAWNSAIDACRAAVLAGKPS